MAIYDDARFYEYLETWKRHAAWLLNNQLASQGEMDLIAVLMGKRLFSENATDNAEGIVETIRSKGDLLEINGLVENTLTREWFVDKENWLQSTREIIERLPGARSDISSKIISAISAMPNPKNPQKLKIGTFNLNIAKRPFTFWFSLIPFKPSDERKQDIMEIMDNNLESLLQREKQNILKHKL